MTAATDLLRPPTAADTYDERQRTSSTYNPLYTFRLPRGGAQQYNQQYGDMYFLRLARLKPVVEKIAEEDWADFEIAGERAQQVERVLDVRQGQLCWVVGTIYMDLPLKPNILEDISKEHWVAAPPPRKTYFTNSDEMQVFLEDESGRLRLTGSMLQTSTLVTGVILAVLGTENANGDFEVLDLKVPELAEQPKRWQKDDEEVEEGMEVDRPSSTGKKIAVISGLSFSGTDGDSLAHELLKEYLLGESLDTDDQDSATNISHLIIAGNSISSDTIDSTINPHDEIKKPAHKKYGYDSSAYNPTPTSHLDQFLSELLPSLSITLLPGEHDPANSSFPQQPIHPAMFPHSRNYGSSSFADPESVDTGWFDSTTNPASFDLEGHRYLATSGQNLDDILKYLPSIGGPNGDAPEGRLSVMETMLRWRNVAPTAPDTLWCYPFQDKDQFVIENGHCPHVFLVGNQPRFESVVIEGPEEQKVRLVTVPSFRESGRVILIDADTLEVELVQISSEDSTP